MSVLSPIQPQSIQVGSRVSTPAGTGDLQGVADVIKRGSTDIESVDALVFVDGIGRQTFDIREIAAEASKLPKYDGTHFHGEFKPGLV